MVQLVLAANGVKDYLSLFSIGMEVNYLTQTASLVQLIPT